MRLSKRLWVLDFSDVSVVVATDGKDDCEGGKAVGLNVLGICGGDCLDNLRRSTFGNLSWFNKKYDVLMITIIADKKTIAGSGSNPKGLICIFLLIILMNT